MKTLRLITAMIMVVGLIGVFPAIGAEQTKQKGKKEGVLTDTQKSKDQKKTLTPGSSSIQPPAANLQSLPLTIQKLYVKDGTVHVVIKKQGSTRLADEDYAATKLKVEASTLTKPLEWTLLEVDPHKRFTQRVRREQDFDTGLAVTERTRVTATLYRGIWKTAKQGTLFPMMAEVDVQTRMAAPEQKRDGVSVPEPVLLFYEGGDIRIGPPDSHTVIDLAFSPDPDAVTISVSYDNRDPLPPGDVTFSLCKVGPDIRTDIVFAETTHRFATYWETRGKDLAPVGWEEAFTWDFQETFRRDLPCDGLYYIRGEHENGAWGISSPFFIDCPGEGGFEGGVEEVRGEGGYERGDVETAIEVYHPEGGDSFALDKKISICWRMPEATSAFRCGSRAIVKAVRLSDGDESIITPVTHDPFPSHCGTDPWVSVGGPYDCIQWNIERRRYEPGNYQIKVECDEGCIGLSRRFRIDGCDYGIESVHFMGGGDWDEGVDVDDSGRNSSIAGTFVVNLSWNGEEPPVGSEEIFHEVKVISTETGASLRAVGSKKDPFNYTEARGPDGKIKVYLTFALPKYDIPSMMVGNSIPLEFSFTTEGFGLDMDEGNNTLAADLRVLNYQEFDLEMSLDSDDFTLRRRPKIGPLDEYYFAVGFRVNNLSRYDEGDPPDPIRIKIEWHLLYKDPEDTDWIQYPGSEGEFYRDIVGEGGWTEGDIGHTFEASQPSLLPEGRLWRIRFVADPGKKVIDPNRHNNRAEFNFRISD